MIYFSCYHTYVIFISRNYHIQIICVNYCLSLPKYVKYLYIIMQEKCLV